jgi:hypothetical protein
MCSINRSYCRILVGVIFLFITACGSSSHPSSLPASGSSNPTSASPTKPVLPPTQKPTQKPPATALPPLPDFPKLVYFGGGGAGVICTKDRAPDTIEVDPVLFGGGLTACFWLKGLAPDLPFQIRMDFLGPAPQSMTTPPLRIDWSRPTVGPQGQETYAVVWEGYGILPEDEYEPGFAARTPDGTLALYDIGLWLPATLPPGQWRISLFQSGKSVDGYSLDFQLEKDDPAYVSAFGSAPPGEITPSDMISHQLKPKINGQVSVRGVGFPASHLVYVLLYNGGPQKGSAQLMDVRQVQSDPAGSIETELAGPFEPHGSYLILGVSDPRNVKTITQLGLDFLSTDEPMDSFLVVPAAGPGSPNSCPEALPQRMAVNRRGVVCTKTDPVRLRDAPSRSGGVILELNPGVQFTVREGPVCADAWSWWRIQTDEGQSGWISEGAGDAIDPYYICPLN